MSLCLPPLVQGGHTLVCWREGVGGSQFGRGDRHCGTLGIYIYLEREGPGTSLLSPSLSLLLVSLPLSTVSESGCWRREDRRRGIGCGCGWQASGSSTVWNQNMLFYTGHRIFISMQRQFVNVAKTLIDIPDTGYEFFPSRIPDPNFFHYPGSRIHIKEFKYLNPKKWFLSSRKYDPGCSSLILIFYPSRIQRSKRHRISGSRIRNTAVWYKMRLTNKIKGHGCAIPILSAQRSEVYFYKAS